MNIGSISLKNNLFSAPMAGVSDQPFRQLCLEYGAGLTYSEMILANPQFWEDKTTQLKQQSFEIKDQSETSPVQAVQIIGNDPVIMGETAALCEHRGAHLIDINMGCPAKKVNKKLSGSALMQYPDLVKSILKSVVNSTRLPVTLKIRTGWNRDNKNGLDIAKMAEDCGVKSLTVHGRTREDLFKGDVDYDTIRQIKQSVSIPVIANGDIDSPEKAKWVLDYTQADAIMIGRAAQGYPWIFEEIEHYLKHGVTPPPKTESFITSVVLRHVIFLHQFYGEKKGVSIARKHVFWYSKHYRNSSEFRDFFGRIEEANQQLEAIEAFFNNKHNMKS